MNVLAQAQAEDELIEQLNKRIADLERSNTLLKGRFKQDIQAENKLMVTIDEFCKLIGISKPTFYKLHKEGKAPPLTRLDDTRRQFIKRSDMDSWMNDKSNFGESKLYPPIIRKKINE